MKQLFIVMVEKRSSDLGKHIKLFERQVEIDTSLSLPYESITQSLRFLFGVDSIIVFKLDLYGKD